MAESEIMAQGAEAPAETLAHLQHLKAAATKEYSLKNYSAAAELYSEATEIQAELNGEMSPENAEILYTYGRCLYKVAVSNSDVLGGKVAGGEEPKKKKKRKTAPTGSDALKSGEEKTAEESLETVVEEKDGLTGEAKKDDKPFFQITGDENWTDSEDEEDGAGAEGEAEEEDDDFAIAYEILDVARVLLGRQIEALDTKEQESNGKGKGAQTDTMSAEKRTIMERLADTHDLQAEISLENERFSDAVTDSRSALELKIKLFPQENSLVAEAHFKLSLALEFASVTTVQTEGEAAEAEQPATIDEELRKESATQMESAIASCKLRVKKETESLASLKDTEKKDKERSIKDVEEMVQDMEQRLVDLRDPSVALNGVTGPAGAPDGSNPLGGILGSLLGESAAQQKVRIQEATKTANDLTGMVRKKKTTDVKAEEGSGKRKLEDDGHEGATGKKAKIEDA